jgi:hypothetical protein
LHGVEPIAWDQISAKNCF